MSDVDDRVDAAIVKFDNAAAIVDFIANQGVGQYANTASGPVPSIAEWQMIHADQLGNIPALQTAIEAQTAAINRLFDNVDPTYGAALQGFRRDLATLPNYVADILKDQAISVTEVIPRSQWAAMRAGTTAYDATTVVQGLLDWAALNKKSVIVPPEYTVLSDTLVLKDGLQGFFGQGTLKCKNPLENTGIGLIVAQGSFYGDPSVYKGLNNCYIGGGLKLDLNNSAKRGLFLNGMNNCRIDNVTSINLGRNSSAAIRLNWDNTDNIIQNCRAFMPVITLDGEACYGVQLVGSDVEFSGWGNGSITPATHKNLRNKIIDCWSYNGTHGFSLTGSDETIIVGCTGYGNYHRALHLINSSYNNFTGNSWLYFGSAAMIMAYGSSRNTGTGNLCFSSVNSGESAVECYVGSNFNTLKCTTIRSAGNYALYVAIESNGNRFIATDVDATSLKKAVIGIESEWMDSPPSPFIYSRPNYGAPPPPRTSWATNGTNGNVFRGTTIVAGNASIAAVYGSQIGSLAASILNSVLDTYIEDSAFAHTFYLVEATAGLLTQWNISGTTTSYQMVGKAFATRGRAHMQSCFNNDTFNGKTYFAVNSGTTPTVFNSDKLDLRGYTQATTITNFVGGHPGQTIRVLLNTFTTLSSSGGLIVLKGGASSLVGTANSLVDFENRAGVWYETGRNT